MAIPDLLTYLMSGVSIMLTILLTILVYQIYVTHTYRPDLKNKK